MYFDDEPGNAPTEKVDEALRLYLELLRVAGVEPSAPEPGTPQLSFHLAAPMPLDLDFKQSLLGMRNEGERIAAIVEYYEALLPRMRHAVKARQKKAMPETAQTIAQARTASSASQSWFGPSSSTYSRQPRKLAMKARPNQSKCLKRSRCGRSKSTRQ